MDTFYLNSADQRMAGIKITETGMEREKGDRKIKNASKDKTRSGGGEGNDMMEKTHTKRETRRGEKKRSAFGKREGMRMPESPLGMVISTSLRKKTERMTVPKRIV